MGHERSLALDPVDDALMLKLKQRLAHDGAGDTELRAETVFAGKNVAGLQAQRGDVLDDVLLELVVHRLRGMTVNVVDGSERGAFISEKRSIHGVSFLANLELQGA
ncbi:hypothetical protein GCM10027056_26160 [Glaciibacter psychrotolerans]